MDDIVSHHAQRMQNLKRYYPFFKLADHTLAQYKDGRYASLDMGYIVLAVLRFFIEENYFKEQDVTYPVYEQFMRTFLTREFAPEHEKMSAASVASAVSSASAVPSASAVSAASVVSAASAVSSASAVSAASAVSPADMREDELKELIQYIFDKLCNDGRPFIYTYYDPAARQQVRARIKLIDSCFKEDVLVYFITGDAIEFYLDTKEVKDESRMTTEQLLLEKLIRSRNFNGALEVVQRINGEMARLMARKETVVRLLGQNIFEGVKALDDFSKHVLSWFKEEQKLFESNKALVDQALLKAEQEANGQIPGEIFALDAQLKEATRRHGELLSACTSLQLQADEWIQKAKNTRFRNVFYFDDFLERMVKKDRMDGLGAFVRPLLGMNLHKTVNLYDLDRMLEYKDDTPEKGERSGEGREQMYVCEDDAASARIESNFDMFFKVLFEQLLVRGSFDLKFLNHMYEMKFTDNILKNGDYFAFIVHLSQKDIMTWNSLRRGRIPFLRG